MKKRYTVLVYGINLIAILIGAFGTLGGFLNGASIYGSLPTAALIVFSSLISAILLAAAAAAVDLLASIEINSSITRDYFEQRLQHTDDSQPKRSTGIQSLPKRSD